MTTDDKRKILDMVADGRLSAQEADSLLAGLEKQRPVPRWGTLLDPFRHVPFPILAGLATAVALASIVAASALGMRFDGALDMHLQPVRWPTALLDQIVAWPVFASILWLAARVAGRRSRFVDHLVMLGVARLHLLLSGLVTVLLMGPGLEGQTPEQVAQHVLDPRMVLGAMAMLPFVVVYFVWLVLGFRAASGLRGGRLAVAFLAGIFVAEIVTKLLLSVAMLVA